MLTHELTLFPNFLNPLTFICYSPLRHWVWGCNFLADGGIFGDIGVKDFAGGIVVHEAEGLAALIIAFFIGQRSNKTNSRYNPG